MIKLLRFSILYVKKLIKKWNQFDSICYWKENFVTFPGSEVVEDVAPPTPSSGKKKKKQKTLLFATTMNRMK